MCQTNSCSRNFTVELLHDGVELEKVELSRPKQVLNSMYHLYSGAIIFFPFEWHIRISHITLLNAVLFILKFAIVVLWQHLNSTV